MLISPAYAQDASSMLGSATSFLPLVLIFAVFYFLLIRPQQQKQKESRAMISAIKRGDRVVTGGGILGTVQRVPMVQDKDGKQVASNEIEVEIAPNIRVTVLRDGRNVFTGLAREASREQIAEAMLGRKLGLEARGSGGGADRREPALSVRGLSLFRHFDEVSFDLYPGEIVVLAGLVGSGRTEVVETVLGLRTQDSGSVIVAGRELRRRGPRRIHARSGP